MQAASRPPVSSCPALAEGFAAANVERVAQHIR